MSGRAARSRSFRSNAFPRQWQRHWRAVNSHRNTTSTAEPVSPFPSSPSPSLLQGVTSTPTLTLFAFLTGIPDPSPFIHSFTHSFEHSSVHSIPLLYSDQPISTHRVRHRPTPCLSSFIVFAALLYCSESCCNNCFSNRHSYVRLRIHRLTVFLQSRITLSTSHSTIGTPTSSANLRLPKLHLNLRIILHDHFVSVRLETVPARHTTQGFYASADPFFDSGEAITIYEHQHELELVSPYNNS